MPWFAEKKVAQRCLTDVFNFVCVSEEEYYEIVVLTNQWNWSKIGIIAGAVSCPPNHTWRPRRDRVMRYDAAPAPHELPLSFSYSTTRTEPKHIPNANLSVAVSVKSDQ
eukprot:m.78975 g.78975  ORF g.78975 m.78975 type:complete len:109 (+) comp16259_c0_seq1:3-329(+)